MSAAATAPRPSPLTWALLAVAGCLLLLVQVTLVNLVPTRWAVPDLVGVGVLAIALSRGPRVGAVVGAAAGLTLDLIPPAAGPVGAWMLVLALGGALMGRAAGTYRPGPFASMAMLAVGSGALVLARAVVIWFAGAATGVPWTTLLLSVLVSAGWGLLLAPAALLLSTPRTRSDRPGPRRSAEVGGAGLGGAGLGGAGLGGTGAAATNPETGPTGTGGRT